MNHETLRTLVERINDERLRSADESRKIHRRWLDGIGVGTSPRAAQALTWSEPLASLGNTRATRGAAEMRLTHSDAATGVTVLEAIRDFAPAAVAGEILWLGLTGWFSEESLYEQLMGTVSPDPAAPRSILLNPAFRHISISFAQDVVATVVVLLYASVDEAELPTGTRAMLLAETARQAPASTAGDGVPLLRIDVFPLWEPSPVRWKLSLRRDATPVRDQIAQQLGVRRDWLRGLGRVEQTSPLFLAKASSPELTDGWQVAISLDTIDASLATFTLPFVPASQSGSARDIPGFSAAMADALGPVTAAEEAMCKATLDAGGSFVLRNNMPGAARILPVRPPGMGEQTVLVHACVDVGTDPSLVPAVLGEMNESGRRAYQIGTNSAYQFAQELFLTWDLDDPAACEAARLDLLRIGQALAQTRGAADSIGIPNVYLQPYRGDEGYRDAILDDNKRIFWLRSAVTGPLFASSLRRASVAAARKFDVAPRADHAEDTLSFSRSSAAAFMSESDLRASEIYWQGLEQSVRGIFQDIHVSEAACQQEALDILSRCGILWTGNREDDDFDPVAAVQDSARLPLRAAAWRHLSRVAAMPFSELKRRGEPDVIAELLRWQQEPAAIAGSVAGLLGAAREALWRSLSVLHREVGSMYRRHLAGSGGRNIASCIAVCELLDAHLRGDRSPFHHRLPDGSRVVQGFDRADVAIRSRVAGSFREIEARYSHWLRRALRFLFRNGRSRLPADLVAPLESFFDDVITLFVSDFYRRSLASADAMPWSLADALTRHCASMADYANEELAKHDRILATLTAGQTVFVSDRARTIADAQAAARSYARRLWNDAVGNASEQRWMAIGEPILAPQGKPENPFAPRSGAVFNRLVSEIGRKAAALAQTPAAGEIRADVIQSKARRLLTPSEIDAVQLATIVPPSVDGDVVSRTYWHVIAGIPHPSFRENAEGIRSALEDLQHVSYARMDWIEAPGMTGLFIFQDIHGLSRSSMQS